MHLATIRVEVQIGPGFRSKRKTIRAILDRVHRHFNVAVAELDGGVHPTKSTLGVAALGASRREVRATLDRVAHALAAHPRVEALDIDWTDH